MTSQATLRALVCVILSGSGTSGINFRIYGTHIHHGHFARLKTAIRAGRVNFVVDGEGLARSHAEASYQPRTNTITMRPSAVRASKDIPIGDQAALVHEAFHAICDMDRIDNLSPTQEESCGALCSGLYVLLQYSKSWAKHADGPLTSLCKLVRKTPGMEIWGNPHFDEIYERVYGIYRANHTMWGRVSNYRDGL